MIAYRYVHVEWKYDHIVLRRGIELTAFTHLLGEYCCIFGEKYLVCDTWETAFSNNYIILPSYEEI